MWMRATAAPDRSRNSVPERLITSSEAAFFAVAPTLQNETAISD
jgi:hypothetical protein